MKKYLLAYQISGQTVGIDIETYNPTDLNGNSAMQIILDGETIPNGYVDISSIKNWDRFGEDYANDYMVVREALYEILVDGIYSKY